MYKNNLDVSANMTVTILGMKGCGDYLEAFTYRPGSWPVIAEGWWYQQGIFPEVMKADVKIFLWTRRGCGKHRLYVEDPLLLWQIIHWINELLYLHYQLQTYHNHETGQLTLRKAEARHSQNIVLVLTLQVTANLQPYELHNTTEGTKISLSQ